MLAQLHPFAYYDLDVAIFGRLSAMLLTRVSVTLAPTGSSNNIGL
jgi:hypothetical protein